MEAPAPLGMLGVLPRELRTQIYGHLIGKEYCAHHSQTINHPQGPTRYCPHARQEFRVKGLNLLFTSATMYEDMSEVLYKATFRFQQNIDASDALAASPSTKLTYRMMKIECDYDIIPRGVLTCAADRRKYDLLRASPGPLVFFVRDEIQRTSIQLEFLVGPFPGPNRYITESPLFEAMRQLYCFKIVTVKLRADSNYYYPATHTHVRQVIELWEDAGNSMDELENCHELYDGFIDLLDKMRVALEPALGPGTMSNLYAGRYGSLRNGGYRHLEFHPRDYIANRSEASRHFREAEKKRSSVASISGIEELGPSMGTLAI